MKKILTNSISSGIGMPIKSGVLEHLQNAYTEITAAAIKALINRKIYDNTKVYVLYGVVNSGSNPTVNTTGGAVYFNGEVYIVDATSFTISGGEVAICQFDVSYYSASNADPVEFTDGVSRNVHQINKIKLLSGGTGTGVADFSDFVYLDVINSTDVLTKDNTTSFTPISDYEPATKKYVDSKNLVGIIAKGTTGTIVETGTGVVHTISIGATITGDYNVIFTPISSGGIPDLMYSIQNKTSTSFDITIKSATNTNQNIAIEWFVLQ